MNDEDKFACRVKPRCPHCNTPWTEHPGLTLLCAEVERLKEARAACESIYDDFTEAELLGQPQSIQEAWNVGYRSRVFWRKQEDQSDVQR